MINLKNKQQIILESIEGVSQREIARKYGLSRNTVTKYIKEYQEATEKLLTDQIKSEDIPLLTSVITETPKYNTESRKKVKLTQEVIKRIEQMLKENEDKKSLGITKQNKKAIDIYESLIEEGIDISYATVCNAVREMKNSSKEAFIKQHYEYGEVCEFDWGYVKLCVDGDKIETFQMAVFTTAKGNYRYAKLYHSQKMECFLDAHTKFFEHVGGSFNFIVYDNMRTAVRKFVSKTEKEPTEELLKLSLYYGFNYRFCNARRGNEKGHVEKSVEYIRRKVFSKKHDFINFDDAQNYLSEQLFHLNNRKKPQYDNVSPYEILQIEKQYLLAKRPVYSFHKVTESRVDKYSCIIVDQNKYSVPDDFVGKFITTFIYPNKVVCFHEHKEIATHKRLYGNHEWSFCIQHYTKTLSRKPGALANSVAFKQTSDNLQKIYQCYYTKNPKDFIVLIEYISLVGIEKVNKAIEKLEKLSPLDISTEKIKMICQRVFLNEEENKGDSTIIETSKNNIDRIIAMYGLKTTTYEEVTIL